MQNVTNLTDSNADIFSILAGLLVNNPNENGNFADILSNLVSSEETLDVCNMGLEIENGGLENYIYGQDLLQDVVDIRNTFLNKDISSNQIFEAVNENAETIDLEQFEIKTDDIQQKDIQTNFNSVFQKEDKINIEKETEPFVLMFDKVFVKELEKQAEEKLQDEVPVKVSFEEKIKAILNKSSNKDNGNTNSNKENPKTQEQLNIAVENPKTNFEAAIDEVKEKPKLPVLEKEVLSQIIEKIKVSEDGEVKTIKMQLNPESLGKVKIELVQEKEGIKASFSVDCKKTLKHYFKDLNNKILR